MTTYFEELSVGDTFETGEYTVTKSEIIDFAEQFDPQPFHVDEEAAKESMFGELVASGLHTLCLSVRLFIRDVIEGGVNLANMGGLGMDELRWHEPVPPGTTLRVQIEVVDKTKSTSRSDRGYVEFHRSVLDGDGNEVLTITTHNIVRRRDATD